MRVRSMAAAVLAAAALVAVPGSAAAQAQPVPGVNAAQRVVLVRVVEGPLTLDTRVLAGPKLRAWWIDGCDGRSIDAGSVQRDRAVPLFPPNTGDGVRRKWVLVILDVSAVPLPDVLPRRVPEQVSSAAAGLPPCIGVR